MADEVKAAFDIAFRDFTTDGVPSSGANKVKKSEVRAAGRTVQDQIDANAEQANSAIEQEKTERINTDAALDERITTVENFAAAGIKWTANTVRVRSTANVNIANGLENGDTLNSVTLVTGDVVFLGSQTNAAQNGLYTVVASGAASRAAWADSPEELAYIGFVIQEGDVGMGERWMLPLAVDDITVGTTPLVFGLAGSEVGYAADVVELKGKEAARFPDDIDVPDLIYARALGNMVAEELRGGGDGMVYSDHMSGRAYHHTEDGQVIGVTDGRKFEKIKMRGMTYALVAGGAVLMAVRDTGETVNYMTGQATADGGDGSNADAAARAAQNYPTSTHRADRIFDHMRSWWVIPHAVEVYGNRHAGGVTRRYLPGHPGTVAVGQALHGSPVFDKVIIGNDAQPTLLVDEHNSPAFLPDPRATAAWPLAALQSPHNSGFVRLWRSRDTDARHLDQPIELLALQGVTYNQCYRRTDRPDVVYNWVRGSTGGPWHLMRWDNDLRGQPDAVKTIFEPTIVDYCMTTPVDDGVFIWWSPHPTQVRNIRVMFLTWAGELLSWPGGTQIEDDIWSMASPVDPNDHEYPVFNPGDGARMRLTGVKQVKPLKFQLAVLTGDDVNMSNSRVHLVTASFTIEGSPVFSSLDICDAGIRTGGTSHYLAGADIFGEDKIVVTRWSAPGFENKTVLSVFDCSTGSPVETVIAVYDYKVFRPMVAERQSWDGEKIIREIASWATLVTGYHPEEVSGEPVTALVNNFYDFRTDTMILELGDYQ